MQAYAGRAHQWRRKSRQRKLFKNSKNAIDGPDGKQKGIVHGPRASATLPRARAYQRGRVGVTIWPRSCVHMLRIWISTFIGGHEDEKSVRGGASAPVVPQHSMALRRGRSRGALDKAQRRDEQDGGGRRAAGSGWQQAVEQTGHGRAGLGGAPASMALRRRRNCSSKGSALAACDW